VPQFTAERVNLAERQVRFGVCEVLGYSIHYEKTFEWLDAD